MPSHMAIWYAICVLLCESRIIPYQISLYSRTLGKLYVPLQRF